MPDEKPASDRILLRRATAEDIPLLSAIEAECLEQPWSRTSLAQLLLNESAVCIAAVRQATVIGYGSMYCIADEGSINNIAVLPAFRRMGIGARILGELVSAGRRRGATAFWLEVRASNGAARSLYLKHGFAEKGRRKNYYENPREDALCMLLEIQREGLR